MANYKFTFSPTGGTRRVADILAEGIGGNFSEVNLCYFTPQINLTADDLCLISIPSFGGRVPFAAVDRLKAIQGNGAKAVLVCVYGSRAYEDTLSELQDILNNAGFVCVAAVAAIAEHSVVRSFAAGRPDAADREELLGFAAKIDCSNVLGDLPGSHGTYKDFPGVPFKPAANDDCGGCGVCAGHCPTSAINPENPKEIDASKCFTCMCCVTLCPNQARVLPEPFMQNITAMLEQTASGRGENELFL